jgi:hypothetical protein
MPGKISHTKWRDRATYYQHTLRIYWKSTENITTWAHQFNKIDLSESAQKVHDNQVKNKITEDKICKCSLWGKILHRNKGPQVVQIQRKSVLDNQSKKKLRIEKTLNSLFSLLTCMRKQTAPIQNTMQYQSDSRTKLLLERTLQPEKDQQNLYSYILKSVRCIPTLQPEQHLVTSNN